MRRRLLAATALTCAALLGATPSAADPAQSAVVSANPVDFTPHVLDGTVWALAVVGDTVVVGGSFTRVQDSARKTTYARKNIFAYGLRDGAVRSFAPAVDAAVYALAPGASNTVYLGGGFKTVNGAAQRGLARVAISDGARITAFAAKTNWGDVRVLNTRGAKLYAGGTFSAINGVTRVGLARVDAGTGRVDPGFDAKISAPGLSRPRVEHFDISPDGSRLIAVGALLKVGAAARTQIAMFDITGAAATLTSWYTDAYQPACLAGFDTYLRQVKFSPDGRWFVVAATGRVRGHRRRQAQPDLGPAHRRRLALRGRGDRQRGVRRRPPALPGQPVRQRRQGPGSGCRPAGRHRRDQPHDRQGPGLEPEPGPGGRRARVPGRAGGPDRRLGHRQAGP
jgi:hypothetical protein